MQLSLCLYANWVGLMLFSRTAFNMGVVRNFFECSCDHGRDVTVSVVRILFGDVDLWYTGLLLALFQEPGQV